jgi:hypothetical protein
MRFPPAILLILAVATLATAVLLRTAPVADPAGRPESGATPHPEKSDSPDAMASADELTTGFPATAAEYRANAPRRRDDLGRPLPFREGPLDGSLVDFLQHAQTGRVFPLEPFDGIRLVARITGRVHSKGEDMTSARFEGRPESDRMFFSQQGEEAHGLVLLPSENRAYEILGHQGAYTVREWLYQDVVCATPLLAGQSAESGLPRPQQLTAARPSASARITAAEVPVLQSLPGAPHVIYLDFDGETVSNTVWTDAGRSIVAPAARMTASQVRETWERVCRDFEPFAVNITTVRSDYDNAATRQKIHCVITANDEAAPGAGGVAFLDSFSSAFDTRKVCWSFEDSDAKDCAEVISHELGHTFSLNHDGRRSPAEEYYEGHGSGETGWAPIMGIGYYRQLTQWSKGEYPSANNQEDDLAIIASPENLPLAADDHGSITSEPTPVIGDRADGMVTSSTDNDHFSITLEGGAHTIDLTPAAHGNIDLELQVQAADGTVLATANPLERLSATASFALNTPQTVILRVAGRGKPEVLGTGYSGYGSLGSYSITGFGNQEQPPLAPSGLSSSRLSGTQIRVTWSQNPSADSYAVYRDGQLLSFVYGTEFLDDTVQPATTYNYSVTAWNTFGEGPPSSPATVETPAFDEFIMDGQPDFAGYLVSDPGMTIYAAVRGTKLYLATWSPGDNGAGSGNDHFVFVSNALLGSATVSAPWTKAGLIAIPGDQPYLAGESEDTFAAWNGAKGPTSLAKARLNSGVMEGVIDLVAEFGSVPENVFVAAVAYATEDGGRINSQAPPGNQNNNLEPGEFLRIPVAAVSDRKLNGIYDILDAARGFAVVEAAMDTESRPVLRWPVVPGANYQVQSRDTFGTGSWQNLLTTPRTAGETEWEMEFTDTNAPATSRFYRVTQP